jgi:inhibitor of the pro-sigma K processing machinery
MEGGVYLEPVMVITLLGGLIVVFLLVGAPIKPLRFVGQGVVKILIGALLLFFLNTIGSHFGIHIPINLATSTISGFLGVPGLFALVAIDTWIM